MLESPSHTARVELKNLMQEVQALFAEATSATGVKAEELRHRGLLAATFALVLWSALLVVLTWEAMGWTILLWLAAAYSLLAWLLLRQARRLLGSGQLGLPATMAELRADRDALFDRAS